MNAWPIKIEDEISYWETYLIDRYTYQPKICPLCGVGKYTIRRNSKSNLCNPFILACGNKKCQKKKI